MFDPCASGLLPQRWWEHSIDHIASLAPLQLLHWPLLKEHGVELLIKRDDLLHPFLSGNKFYKLFGHIHAFNQSSHRQWLTFGGAYSNHIHAFAAASAQLGIPSIAIIRGERPKRLSPTLNDAVAMGVQLKFVSRSEYRLKRDPLWLAGLKSELGDFYCIPEGGDGAMGAEGCAAWMRQTLAMSTGGPFSAVCLAAGTGCSSAGVLSAAKDIPVHVYLSLKGDEADHAIFTEAIVSLANSIKRRGDNLPALTLESNYHCGGYARFPDVLRAFVADFEQQTDVPLDPLYTAKLFWGIAAQVQAGRWPRGSRLLVLHTGGMQGRRGFSGL